jgi:hypothetical protein
MKGLSPIRTQEITNVRILKYLVSAAVIVLGAAANARAAGYISPGVGVTFGNPSAVGRADFVADFGWLPREPLGAEVDFMYAPSFFGNNGPFGQNSVTTVMGNIILAGSGDRGGYRRRSQSAVRPYLSGGLGLLHETVTAASSGTVSNDHLGANAGVGVMAVSRRGAGFRADVRYFRDLMGGSSGNVDWGGFHFWRASVGIVLGF